MRTFANLKRLYKLPTSPAATATMAVFCILPSQFLFAFNLLLLCYSRFVFVSAKFNFQVGPRVHERLTNFMGLPSKILDQMARYRSNGAFPNDMRAPDRDAFQRFNGALMDTYPQFDYIYYGLEDGLFVGHDFSGKVTFYREPGNSGFKVNAGAKPSNLMKHYSACVDDSGGDLSCQMDQGGNYIECVDGCSLQKCQDEESQMDCLSLNSTEAQLECEKKINWCQNYVIKQSSTDPLADPLGYVPRFSCCISPYGVNSQALGGIEKAESDELGNCYYTDQITLVERKLSGEFDYCGGDGAVCDNAFDGCFTSDNYDPRWRPWYITTRERQKSNWSPPYIFFESTFVGISFSRPIYSTQEDGKNIFAGVLAVDYTLSDISSFLTRNYDDKSVIVAIVEKSEPNYLIASSTGSILSKMVMKNDNNKSCLDPTNDDCTLMRVSIASLANSPSDSIIYKTHEKQAKKGFPEKDLVTVDSGEGKVYITQSISFSMSNEALDWRIMTMIPVKVQANDTIQPGDQIFGLLLVVSLFGFFICLILFALFFKQRGKGGDGLNDCKLIEAFLLSCVIMNAVILSLMGPNTDEMCLLRMWSLHFFFTLALSPLYVNTYQMYKKIEADESQFKALSPSKTAMMVLFPLVVQVASLIIFTYVDPYKQDEIIESEGADVIHRMVCRHETIAFHIVELIIEGGLILTSFALALKSLVIKNKLWEAKQTLIVTGNITLVGVVVIIVSNAANMSEGTMSMFVAVGIFWASSVSCSIFVFPKLLRLHRTMLSSRSRQAVPSLAAAPVLRKGQTRSVNNSSTSAFSQVGQSPSMIINESQAVHEV